MSRIIVLELFWYLIEFFLFDNKVFNSVMASPIQRCLSVTQTLISLFNTHLRLIFILFNLFSQGNFIDRSYVGFLNLVNTLRFKGRDHYILAWMSVLWPYKISSLVLQLIDAAAIMLDKTVFHRTVVVPSALQNWSF